jgi:hypothetical protein
MATRRKWIVWRILKVFRFMKSLKTGSHSPIMREIFCLICGEIHWPLLILIFAASTGCTSARSGNEALAVATISRARTQRRAGERNEPNRQSEWVGCADICVSPIHYIGRVTFSFGDSERESSPAAGDSISAFWMWLGWILVDGSGYRVLYSHSQISFHTRLVV